MTPEGEVIYEVSMLHGKISKLEAENKRLRELLGECHDVLKGVCGTQHWKQHHQVIEKIEEVILNG